MCVAWWKGAAVTFGNSALFKDRHIVYSTSNISRICTMSSLISKKPLTEYGMQPYGPPCGSTIAVQI